MLNFFTKRINRKNKKGFTLIELIVVIAILAIIAAIGVPAITAQIAKANQSTADSTTKQIVQQAEVLISQQEVSGGTPLAVTDAQVLAAAGIDSAKFDSISAIGWVQVDEDGVDVAISGNPAVSKKVGTVTVVKKGKTSTFTR